MFQSLFLCPFSRTPVPDPPCHSPTPNHKLLPRPHLSQSHPKSALTPHTVLPPDDIQPTPSRSLPPPRPPVQPQPARTLLPMPSPTPARFTLPPTQPTPPRPAQPHSTPLHPPLHPPHPCPRIHSLTHIQHPSATRYRTSAQSKGTFWWRKERSSELMFPGCAPVQICGFQVPGSEPRPKQTD